MWCLTSTCHLHVCRRNSNITDSPCKESQLLHYTAIAVSKAHQPLSYLFSCLHNYIIKSQVTPSPDPAILAVSHALTGHGITSIMHLWFSECLSIRGQQSLPHFQGSRSCTASTPTMNVHGLRVTYTHTHARTHTHVPDKVL